MKIRVANTGGPQTVWVDLVAPHSVTAPMLKGKGRDGWRAYRTERGIGGGQLYHLLATDLQAGQTVVDEMVPGEEDPPDFVATDWIVGDVEQLIPRVVVRAGNKDIVVKHTEVKLVETTGIRQVWHLRGGAEGFWMDFWAYVYTFQDIIRYEMKVTWSDRTTPAWMRWIDGMWMETGEYASLDFGQAYGLPQPFFDAKKDAWVRILAGPSMAGDGEQRFFRGRILPVSRTNATDARISNLLGSMKGDAYAATPWRAKWLALGRPADIGAHQAELDGAEADFEERLRRWGDYYDERPRGLARQPWQTGAQPDFGATKGSEAAWLGDPRWIRQAWYSWTDPFRPYHHLEADGKLVTKHQHPEWVTWSQMTDHRLSKDMLGKPSEWHPAPWSGFHGIDDQHHSRNLRNALYQMTGSYAIADDMRYDAENDLAAAHDGAPRAIGRTLQAQANRFHLSEGATKVKTKARIEERLADIWATWPGKIYVGDEKATVRVLSTMTDPRTLRHPMTGQPLEAWVVWEHSLAAIGLESVFRVTIDQRAEQLAAEVSKTVVLHGFAVGEAVTRYDAVMYKGGDPISEWEYENGYAAKSDDRQTDPFWTLAAVAICRKHWPELESRCDRILAAYTPGRISDLEWLAVG